MIVVVDDDEGIRATYQHCLRARGFDVRCAADGEAALQLLSRQPSATVLLDIFMPGMEGIETLRRIKREHPKSKVITMSGARQFGVDMLKATLALGADASLEKPFALDQLLALIS